MLGRCISEKYRTVSCKVTLFAQLAGHVLTGFKKCYSDIFSLNEISVERLGEEAGTDISDRPEIAGISRGSRSNKSRGQAITLACI